MTLSVGIKAQLRRGIGSTAMLASGLLSPMCWSAPGDLDPPFGDVGRALLPVTLTSTAGTTTADDFDANPVIISWPDGDMEPRAVTLAIEDDRDDEPNESFTVTLAQPTGGAVVSPLSSVSITISDDDSSGGGRGGSSGGGRFGLLSLLLLGAAGLRRWAWREHDRRCDDVRRRLRPELRRYAEAGRR